MYEKYIVLVWQNVFMINIVNVNAKKIIFDNLSFFVISGNNKLSKMARTFHCHFWQEHVIAKNGNNWQ